MDLVIKFHEKKLNSLESLDLYLDLVSIFDLAGRGTDNRAEGPIYNIFNVNISIRKETIKGTTDPGPDEDSTKKKKMMMVRGWRMRHAFYMVQGSPSAAQPEPDTTLQSSLLFFYGDSSTMRYIYLARSSVTPRRRLLRPPARLKPPSSHCEQQCCEGRVNSGNYVIGLAGDGRFDQWLQADGQQGGRDVGRDSDGLDEGIEEGLYECVYIRNEDGRR
ncbi:hypothetical protein TRV_02816 [Trichophyton verrucosum HKI 0517]|uniref:Uncharacterized protein n=1 Tax=Trichophyton verrucosum (strain HKI 0517) TaxID=663202 RepID=D4D6T9_TRIVH|nr:uncharacterized protein TRV_02816 [Trichophyton verrucosum HKI 0517]EFE42451.1 hypothetical protein TRV_02816 [Trichophyton verrucosum HKI 0517]